MNKINFIVSTKKLKNAGLNLNSKILTDIKIQLIYLKILKMKCKITNKSIEPFMTFGKMPIANGFIEKENFDKEFFFEMEVGFSNELSLFQLNDHPKPELMFNEKYPFFTGSSEYMKEHFRKFSQYLKNNYLGTHSKLIEIGSNDGTLLKNFIDQKDNILGFEPSKNVADLAKADGVPTTNEFFNSENASKYKKFFRSNRCNFCFKLYLSYTRFK